MIGQTISHYRITDKLGEGGMGVVYVAEDVRLRRRVAVKFSNVGGDEQGYRARFLREARAISALSHPHIATVYDYGETDEGQPFIVMEFVSGSNLCEVLREGSLTLQRGVGIVAEVAEALAEAHRYGIIHRDIKPSNVMINHRQEVKVLDFGLAKQVEGEGGYSDIEAPTLMASQTRSNAVIGTLLYLSPEQAIAAPVDARSDLFALGAVLYECVAGRPAFSGVNPIEVCAQILHVDPPPPSRFNSLVTPELDRITLKALAKRPEHRYQSARELVADLHAVRETLNNIEQVVTQRISPAAHTPRISALTSFSSTLRRPRFSVFFLAAMLALVVSAVWGISRLWRPDPYRPSPEAARWYQKGEGALRDGTYYTASRALESAVKSDDGYALAHARLAEAWMELDYADRASQEIARARSLAPDLSRLSPLEALHLQAINDTVIRKFADAIISYREILRRAPEAEKAYAHLDLGRTYEKNEEVGKAMENYIAATVRNPESAAAFLRLGILNGRQQNPAGAAGMFDKAEKLYQDFSNFEGVTEVYYQRGLLYKQNGELAKARDQSQRALAIAQTTTNNRFQQINALLQLSNVSLGEGNTGQAQQLAKEAVDLARAERMENLATNGLIDLGNSFLYRNQIAEAEGYFRQALELASRDHGRLNKAKALLSLGKLHYQQDAPVEARSYAEQSLPLFEKGGYLTESSQALKVIGYTNVMKGDYDAALQAFQQQHQLAEQSSNPLQIASSKHAIGFVRAHQEQYTEALSHFGGSYEINRKLGMQLEALYDLTDDGDMLWRLGRYKESQEALDKAFSIANLPDESYRRRLPRVYLIKALMMLSRRRLAEAAELSRQAIRLAGAEDRNTLVEAKYTLGITQALTGATNEGKQMCLEAVAMAKSIDDARLMSSASLSLAEVLIEGGDSRQALTTALELRERFERADQQDSLWHMWRIAAYASYKAGDAAQARVYAANALDVLSKLQPKWGTENYNSFRARPDVQLHLKELDKLLGTPQLSRSSHKSKMEQENVK
ncbi:MAG: protein kinase [Acidobacteriota bacterium]|nr:protein kinase [Acidobacteriota bacterium]